MIAEDRLVGLQLAAAFDQQGAQQVGGLGPQRADPFFPPLAMQADMRGRVQAQVGDAQDDDFLDPRAGVEHGGEERIVAAAAVAPVELQVLKKREDRLGSEVVQVQLDDGPLRPGCDEAQQEHQAVPIAPDGVGTRPSHPGQMVGEERPEGSRQIVRAGCGHRAPPATMGPVMRSPQWSANRALAAVASGSTNCR